MQAFAAVSPGKMSIRNWKQFSRQVRSRPRPLLQKLPDYPNCVLVSGCQRSGTTLVSRMVRTSPDIAEFPTSRDDELDGALLLSGETDCASKGRFCFQTTYLNERYVEYRDHMENFQLIWVIRNPFSVVWSMLHHWKRFALEELFRSCGLAHLKKEQQKGNLLFAGVRMRSLEKACASYLAKAAQLFEIHAVSDGTRLLVIGYEELIRNPPEVMAKIEAFLGISFEPGALDLIHPKSMRRHLALTRPDRDRIQLYCMPVYHAARALLRRENPSKPRVAGNSFV